MGLEKMKNSKHTSRYITFTILILILGMYLFIGAIATEWSSKPDINIANYCYIGLTSVLLIAISYEITKLICNQKINYFAFVFSSFIGLLMYLFPVDTSLKEFNFAFYNQIDFSWLKSWMIILVFLFCFALYFLNYLIVPDTKMSQWFLGFMTLILMVFALKGLTRFMLSPSYGWSSVIWLFLIIISTDTFAFVGGISFGKRKLAPEISPNKTIEGAIFGVTMAMIIGCSYALLQFYFGSSNHWVFDFFSNDPHNIVRIIVYILLTFMLSIISILGDLWFSWIKRGFEIKDFSNLLPGHGGVMDRLDSVSVVFAMMFLLMEII